MGNQDREGKKGERREDTPHITWSFEVLVERQWGAGGCWARQAAMEAM